MLLQDIDEDSLITRLREQLGNDSTLVGIGDDCAVLPDGTLLKTDCIIEGRHYLPETPARQVGYKAVARVLSDFAAMGGTPNHILVTIAMRARTSVEYIEQLYEGMTQALAPYGASIVGGETATVPDEAVQLISISGTGSTGTYSPILRSSAQIGDRIYVSGELGRSFESGHHLNFTPRISEAQWLQEHARPSAMMDLSDGLARDLPRLAKASRTGYSLDLSRLPLRAGGSSKQALQDGEDYELLFTLSQSVEKNLICAPHEFTQIGEITTEMSPPLSGGWDHLQS